MLKETLTELKHTFKNRYGKLDEKRITAFVAFVILVISWIADQFLNKKVNESVFETFALLLFGLLGLTVLPWKKQGTMTEDEHIPEPKPRHRSRHKQETIDI
jgi:hypothetical protein